jgi:hypothetical protein
MVETIRIASPTVLRAIRSDPKWAVLVADSFRDHRSRRGGPCARMYGSQAPIRPSTGATSRSGSSSCIRRSNPTRSSSSSTARIRFRPGIVGMWSPALKLQDERVRGAGTLGHILLGQIEPVAPLANIGSDPVARAGASTQTPTSRSSHPNQAEPDLQARLRLDRSQVRADTDRVCPTAAGGLMRAPGDSGRLSSRSSTRRKPAAPLRADGWGDTRVPGFPGLSYNGGGIRTREVMRALTDIG